MKALIKRRSAIIKALCDLSRNGWNNAKSYDYESLETELLEIQIKLGAI